MPPKGKYTDPKLRDKVKEEVQNSDKGGAPGQWSARKAQFMASEYKKQGGSYTTDKETGQDESQKNLQKWGDEDWQTKDGSGTAKHEDGTRERYLPKKAWDQMDDEEKEKTDEKKQEASANGQQHVANTGKAKQARSNVNKESDAKDESKGSKQFDAKDENKGSKQSKSTDSKQSKQTKAKDGKQVDGSAARRSGRSAKQESEKKTKAAAKEPADDDSEEFEDPGADDDVAQEHPDAKAEDADAKDETAGQNPGQKRGRQTKTSEDSSSKKQKANDGKSKSKSNGTIGSKHDSADEPAPAASADRLPKKGQRVSWKSLPGWVHGETVEVLTKEKTVDGKKVKASEKDPRIVMKSDNGKIAVHKPSAVHFED